MDKCGHLPWQPQQDKKETFWPIQPSHKWVSSLWIVPHVCFTSCSSSPWFSHCVSTSRPKRWHEPQRHMKVRGDESMWEAFRSNTSCSWMFSGCHPLGREKQWARQERLSYIMSAAAAWHVWSRSESLLLTPPAWGARVVMSVCEGQRAMVLRGGLQSWPRVSGGLLLIAQLSLLIMSVANQCIRQ